MGRVVVELTGDEAKLLRSLDKVIAKERELAQKAAQAGQASAQAGGMAASGFSKAGDVLGQLGDQLEGVKKGVDQALGPGAAASLAAFGAAAGGVAAIISTIASAWNAADEARKRAIEGAREGAKGLESLVQLADSPESLQALQNTAARISARSGLSLPDAGKLTFALSSAGAIEDADLFADLSGIVEDPAALAKATATLRASLGEEETGSLRDLVSKGFAASARSPATVEALLEGAARSGAFGRDLGASDEAILAATALTATSTGSAEMGGTQVASLIKSLATKEEFQGMGLRGAVDLLAEKELSPGELLKFLGRSEAVAGFSVLSNNREFFEQVTGEVFDAEEDDLVSGRLGLRGTSGILAAGRLANLQERRTELQTLRQGSIGALADAQAARNAREFRELGAPETMVQLGITADEVLRSLFGDERFVRAGAEGSTPIARLSGEASSTEGKRALEILSSIDQQMRELNRGIAGPATDPGRDK